MKKIMLTASALALGCATSTALANAAHHTSKHRVYTLSQKTLTADHIKRFTMGGVTVTTRELVCVLI